MSPPRSSSPRSLVLNLPHSPDVVRKHRRHASPEKSPLVLRKQQHRYSYNSLSDVAESESHDATPEPGQMHDSPLNVRQDSQDKSPDSKEASPRSKEASPRTKRWSGDATHQLSLQQRDSLDSQPDTKQSDSGKETEIPLISEPILLDHRKTSSTDSKHSEGTVTSHTHEPPSTESDNEPRSIISPTLKLAPVHTDTGDGDATGEQPLNDDALYDMLEKSSDGLPENVSDSQSPDTSHDTSGGSIQDDLLESNSTSDEHHEHMLSPIVEGSSVHSSSGRQSPTIQDDFDTTVTESPVVEGREENDGLEILAQLDEVLDMEDLESDDEEEDEGSKFKGGGPADGEEADKDESTNPDLPEEGSQALVDKTVHRYTKIVVTIRIIHFCCTQ